MVANNSLLDAIGTSGPAGSDSITAEDRIRIVNELVAAALDEHAHIEAIDSYGPNNKCRRFLTEPMAATFRKMHEDWLASAEALLTRCQAIAMSGQTVARLSDLKDAVLATRVILKITIEGIERGLEQIRRGEFITLEEGRRELRAKLGK